jgi:hypothetical protein
MKRVFPGSGVAGAGFLLAAGGAYAMWTGWDMILLERGWSLFIAGSVALSGGVVTMALGRVVAHLARLSSPVVAAAPVAKPVETPPPVRAEAPAPRAETPPAAPAPEPPRPTPPKLDFAAFMAATAEAASPASPPVEVDRYSAGDSTYIMMSDGSVEVHGPGGAQTFPSLAALRAEAAARRG